MRLIDDTNSSTKRAIVVSGIVALIAISVSIFIAPAASEANPSGQLPDDINPADVAWTLAATSLQLLLTPATAFFYGGLGLHKNIVSTILQCVMTLMIITPLFMCLGFSLSFGGAIPGYSGLIGDPSTYGLMYNISMEPHPVYSAAPISLMFAYQLTQAAYPPSIMIGAISERVNFAALLLFVCLWHLLIYCPLVYMTWMPLGIINGWGINDYGGDIMLHMAPGVSALIFSWYLGPVKESNSSDKQVGTKFEAINGPETTGEEPIIPMRLRSQSVMNISGPANMPFALLGMSLTWFCSQGYLAGAYFSATPVSIQAMINSNIAVAFSVLIWLAMDYLWSEKIRATGMCYGVVVGLASITGSAGLVNVGAASLIGIIGSLACYISSRFMIRYFRHYIGNSVDIFSLHGVGGIVGLLCNSLFVNAEVGPYSPNGAFAGNPILLGKMIAVICVLMIYITIFTLICLGLTDLVFNLKASDAEVELGLDMAVHGEPATAIEAVVNELAVNFQMSFLDRIKRVKQELNPNLSDTMLQPVAELDRPILVKQIGEGSFGKVYQGVWRGETVAIKCITIITSSASGDFQAEKMAVMEAAISISMQHPNLVRTFTYSLKPLGEDSTNRELLALESSGLVMGHEETQVEILEGSRRTTPASPTNTSGLYHELQLVIEFCDGGSLSDILEQGAYFDETALDIAKGMCHLHDHQVIHSDLKPGNVMLKSNDDGGRGFIAKLVDFGLSVQIRAAEGSKTHKTRMIQGTVSHMAPEILLDGKLSKAADVYAFGIVMFELISGANPYPGVQPSTLRRQVSKDHLRPKFSPVIPGEYQDLAKRCWDANADERPDFHEITSILQSMRENQPGSARPLVLSNQGTSGSTSVHRTAGLKKTLAWKLEDGAGGFSDLTSPQRSNPDFQENMESHNHRPEGSAATRPMMDPEEAALASDVFPPAWPHDDYDDEHEAIVLTAASYRAETREISRSRASTLSSIQEMMEIPN